MLYLKLDRKKYYRFFFLFLGLSFISIFSHSETGSADNKIMNYYEKLGKTEGRCLSTNNYAKYFPFDPAKHRLQYEPYDDPKPIRFPYIKLFSNKEFKGVPIAEVTKDGFSAEGKLICVWEKVSDSVGLKPSSPIGSVLQKISNDKRCELVKDQLDRNAFATIWFEIDSYTKDYYATKFEGVTYYINPKDAAGKYKFVESLNSVKEKEANEIYKLINQDFKKNQTEYLEYVAKMRQCIKNRDKKCIVISDYEKTIFKEYVCMEDLVFKRGLLKEKCANKVNQWKFTKEVEKIFWDSMGSCFFDSNLDRTFYYRRAALFKKNEDSVYISSEFKKPLDLFKCQIEMEVIKPGKNAFKFGFWHEIDTTYQATEDYEQPDSENYSGLPTTEYRFYNQRPEKEECKQLTGRSREVPFHLNDKGRVKEGP